MHTFFTDYSEHTIRFHLTPWCSTAVFIQMHGDIVTVLMNIAKVLTTTLVGCSQLHDTHFQEVSCSCTYLKQEYLICTFGVSAVKILCT